MVDPILPVVSVVAKALGMLKVPKSDITISNENNSSHSLTDVTMYYYGNNSKPPNPIIEPHTKPSYACFEGATTATGMLCYQIEGSYGPSGDPYYLLIGWNLKLTRNNQYCIMLHESKEQPLRGNRKENKNFCKSIVFDKKNTKFPDQSTKLEIDDLIIGATMSSVAPLEMKIQLYPKPITISIENNSLHSLMDVTMYYYGDNSKPPNPIIGAHTNPSHARFEGAMGMLCYRVEGSYGPSGDPYYLLIGWNLKPNRKNQYCIVLHESKEQPLRGNREENKKFCELVLDENTKIPDQSAKLEIDDLIIGATMSSVTPAEMKIQLYSKPTKRIKLHRRFFFFLKRIFRKNHKNHTIDRKS